MKTKEKTLIRIKMNQTKNNISFRSNCKIRSLGTMQKDGTSLQAKDKI